MSESPFWQISTGDLFELLQPLGYALAALVSACVLADALRLRFKTYAVVAWTLGTFFLPLVVLPLYVLVRILKRKDAPPSEASPDTTVEKASEGSTPPRATTAPDESTRADASVSEKHASHRQTPRSLLRIAAPLVYASLLLTLGAVLFHLDHGSVEAHLARASHAKVRNQSERAVREYRAALQLEDNPHTRKLLAVELSQAGRYEEALKEFLAAERGREPDALLPFRIAQVLDALKRTGEALPYYRRFLGSESCLQKPPDPRCQQAQARADEALPDKPR